MSLTQLAPPYPIFTDKNGDPLDNGYLYFGEPNLNPETNPIQVYWDTALTQPAAQPIRTINGYPSRNGTAALIYADSQFSLTVRNKSSELVIYSPAGYGVVPGAPFTFGTSDRTVRDVPTLLADVQFTYTAGVPNTVQVFPNDIINTAASGYSYNVADPSATDNDVQTAGGVKLYVLPDASGGVDVRAFGAVGDGVTNDHAAFQTAINSTATTVFVPDGTYKINSSLTLKSDLAIEINPNAVLDFSSAGSVSYLSGVGTAAAGLSLTSNVSINTKTINVADTSSLSVGDMLLLSSDAIFDPNRTSSKIGELVFVESLTPTSITTTTPIQDNYATTDSAKVQKITPLENIYIYGGKIIGNTTPDSGDLGVRIFYGNNINVENVYFKDIDGACIQFTNCVGAWARSCRFETGVSNSAYGVSFADATRDSGCVSSTFLQLRHSLSTNNTIGGFGVVRRILFSDNVVYQSGVDLSSNGGDAIDTHAAAEAISIIGNKCFGSSGQGINIECQSAQIVGNEIIDSFSNGIAITNNTSRLGQYQISDNIVIRAGAQAIRVDTLPSDASINNLVISNNILQDNTASFPAIIVNNNTTDQTISNVVVSGNSVRNAESSTSSINLLDVSNATVIGNTIELTADGPSGIRLDSAVSTTIANNSISLASGASVSSGINIVSASPAESKNIVVSGNTVNSPSAVDSRGVSISANAVGVVLSGNNFQDCTRKIQGGIFYTIASDEITLVGDVGAIRVDTEGAAATDDLSTINGGIENQVLVVRTTSSARDVTLKDGVGNLRLAGDFTLTHTDDTIALIFIDGIWYELSRSDNA